MTAPNRREPKLVRPVIKRLDHVAIAVRSADAAASALTSRFGLEVVHSEDNELARARLVYLDCGNTFIQLVAPLTTDAPVASFLEKHGEGLHHVCFAVDDPLAAAAAFAGPGAAAPQVGSGRGRPSAFVPGPPAFGVLFECTQFAGEPGGGRADRRGPRRRPASRGRADHDRGCRE